MPEEPQSTDPQQQPKVGAAPQQWDAPKTDQTPMLESEPAPAMLPEHEDTGMSGQPMVNEPKPESQPIPQTIASAPVVESPESKKGNMLIISIIIGVIVVVAGIIIYFSMFAK